MLNVQWWEQQEGRGLARVPPRGRVPVPALPFGRTSGMRPFTENRARGPVFRTQSLRFLITVGMSRSEPKSLDAIGPNPEVPSAFPARRKNGGS